jgi:ABC-type molybdenum transport system ATPase subunit/photorepair protein PhrA
VSTDGRSAPWPTNGATTEVHGDVLRVEDVDLVRNGKHLLDGVDLSVGVGEHWAVIGPSGAGKSSLLSLLGATAHPTRGAVYVLGRRLGRVDMRELRSAIGHVDPRHRLDHPLTPLQVVLTGLLTAASCRRAFNPPPSTWTWPKICCGAWGWRKVTTCDGRRCRRANADVYSSHGR